MTPSFCQEELDGRGIMISTQLALRQPDQETACVCAATGIFLAWEIVLQLIFTTNALGRHNKSSLNKLVAQKLRDRRSTLFAWRMVTC